VSNKSLGRPRELCSGFVPVSSRACVWIAFVAASSVSPALAAGAQEVFVGVGDWRVVERDSGPDNYYAVVRADSSSPSSFLHSHYRPPEHTTVLGFQVPDADRSKVKNVRWKWRAEVLPRGGDECAAGKQDSAAVVYLTFKRALHWYTLKYVWSAVGSKGVTCDRKGGLFSTQETVILESGGPLDTWKEERIDLDADFRAHFEQGHATADVPPFVGIGLMSDGDQTKSESSADFADFVLAW
jgi:hypothetical protein